MNLYASGLRSGIAFTILLLGLVSKRDSWRYFLLVVASFLPPINDSNSRAVHSSVFGNHQ